MVKKSIYRLIIALTIVLFILIDFLILYFFIFLEKKIRYQILFNSLQSCDKYEYNQT